ncbi:MAG TPA: MFS transporter, partial [Stellaceae bacterium]|nr:MFS transporter [Stellaceae bacterium]
LGLSAAAVGLTLACYGAGMVAGALAAPRVVARLPFGVVIAIGPVAGVLASGVMLATIWFPSPLLAGASFFLFGAGPILWVISTVTLRQSVVPASMLGRVSAIFATATGARPIGAAIGALMGGAFGAEAALAIAAAGFLLQAAIILASPVLPLARQPEGEKSLG